MRGSGDERTGQHAPVLPRPPCGGPGNDHYFFREASMMACPSGPADLIQSAVMDSPMLASSFLMLSLGSATVMPLAPSSLMNSLSTRSLVAQPRSSAAAAAFSTASCKGLSRADRKS